MGGKPSKDKSEPKSSSVCPYANTTNTLTTSTQETSKALEHAKRSCPAFRDNTTKNGKTTCPFRNSTNAEEFRKTMMSVPKSHLEKNIPALTASDTSTASASTYHHSDSIIDDDEQSNDVSAQFRLVLEHMHIVSKSLHPTSDMGAHKPLHEKINTDSFLLNGGCPFKSYYHADTSAKDSYESFSNAMESFSLAAIMVKMAAEKDSDANTTPEVESKEEQLHEEKITLSKALKKGTQSSHKAAENVHFVRNFIKGKIKRDLYAILVSNLYFVYERLEDLLDKHAPIHFPSLHKPDQLRRSETLRRDLIYFYGDNWNSKIKPLPATIDYMNRLQNVADNDPILLLSHAYTRYLGDLSGGRVLQRVARKALQLKDKTMKNGVVLSGLDFYDFQHIPNPKSFKNDYRRALDNLDFLTESQTLRLVGEANVAFVLNMRVFEELDVISGDIKGAHVRPLEEALAFFDVTTISEGANVANSNAKCPFATSNNTNSSSDMNADAIKKFHSVSNQTKNHAL